MELRRLNIEGFSESDCCCGLLVADSGWVRYAGLTSQRVLNRLMRLSRSREFDSPRGCHGCHGCRQTEGAHMIGRIVYILF